ncbi:MAG: 50S ribosomal protein L29 [Candidatus Gracilibacteria bacterium]|jgi:ribosomal protein L29
MLEIQELRKLNTKELEKELGTAIRKRIQASNGLKTNQDKKSHLAASYKKYIAQIKTVQRASRKN